MIVFENAHGEMRSYSSFLKKKKGHKLNILKSFNVYCQINLTSTKISYFTLMLQDTEDILELKIFFSFVTINLPQEI